jgi:metallo-beta-lactamase family protein
MIMDSPMGSDILDLFRRSKQWHKLSDKECDEVCSHFRIVSSYRETLNIRADNTPKIVIAGSGMMTGGRILNYLEVHGPHKEDTLLFVGFQAPGTRGYRVLSGEKSLKMYGKWVQMNMQIRQLEGLSAHADQSELIDWLADIPEAPEQFFLVHGEPDQSLALQQKIQEEKGWKTRLPKLFDSTEVV